ncbi:MAG: glycosyltransferase family 39 protein [Rhodomicrobium sp.]
MSGIASQSRAPGIRGWIASSRLWPVNSTAAAGLVLFLIAWATRGAIFESAKSLHFDLLEAFAWGQEFQLGYNQHGPFWAWIAGAWFMVFPNTNTAFVLLEALNATLGLLGAWLLIGLFAKGWTRHAAALLLVATPFYTFHAYKYNANTIFISLWPWTLFFFVRSLDNMKMRDAALFGIFAAASILSKYYAVILLAACALSLAFHPNGRRYILSPLPWMAAAVFAALVLPHAVWALKSGAPPASYAMTLTGKGWPFTIQHAARFLLDILIFQAGPASVVFLAWLMPGREGVVEPADRLPQWRRRFLAVLVLTPPFLTIILGLAFQLKIVAIMAVGTFPLVPLFLMQFAVPLDCRRCFLLAGAVAIGVTGLAVAGAPILSARMAGKKSGPSFLEPRRELAERVTALWHAETHTRLRFAGGAPRYANAIAFYSEDHPSSFVGLDFARALWVTPAKLQQYGLLIACAHEDSECLEKAAPLLSGNWKKMSIAVSRKIGGRETPGMAFDIFIVPPQGAASATGANL